MDFTYVLSTLNGLLKPNECLDDRSVRFLSIKRTIANYPIDICMMATLQEVQGFSVSELGNFVTSKLEGKVDSPDSIAAVLKENKITGTTFLDLTAEELREMMPTIGDRKELKEIIDSFASTVVCGC